MVTDVSIVQVDDKTLDDTMRYYLPSWTSVNVGCTS